MAGGTPYLDSLLWPLPLRARQTRKVQLAAPQDGGAEGWLLPGKMRHCAVATRQKSTARRLVSMDRGGRAVPVQGGADVQTGTTPMLCAAGRTVTILPFPI
jgi:hypothetical protein